MRGTGFIPMMLALAMGAGLAMCPGVDPPAWAQMVTAKRLVLKDGTFQSITRYEVLGDRVHYYSADREEWEDVPSALVDWPATQKWNAAHQPGSDEAGTEGAGATNGGAAGNGASGGQTNQESAAQIDRAEAALRADQRARTPEVAPHLHLPDLDGIWVLDYFQGVPELVHLDQHAGDVNRDASHNVLRAAIDSFRGAQEPVRLDGQSAKVRLHVDEPALYVSLSTNNSEEVEPESALVVNTHGQSSIPDKNAYSSPDSRYAIVRVEVVPGERVIGALRLRRAGTMTQSEDIVPTTATILPGRHWMKLTPKEPLSVGEYALMEILGPGEVNLDVWDFGVSPNAPENMHALTPVLDGR